MPFYRDPASILPEGMQRVLSMIGMRDPRAAMPGPMMTIGPRAVPLANYDDYLQKALGTVLDDFGQVMTRPGGPRNTSMEGIKHGHNLIHDSLAHDPTADLLISMFKGPGKPSSMSAFLNEASTDDMVRWLANLFTR